MLAHYMTVVPCPDPNRQIRVMIETDLVGDFGAAALGDRLRSDLEGTVRELVQNEGYGVMIRYGAAL